MKINKFNESSRWKPNDKILKGTINFEVDTKTIEETEAYVTEIEYSGDIELARYYGIEEWIYIKFKTVGSGEDSNIDFKLFDYLGNEIQDEKDFDDKIELTRKFNI